MGLPTLVPSFRATLVAALVLGLTAAPSLAQSASTTTAPRGTAVVQLSNGATFNWLAKKKTAINGALVSSQTASAKPARFFGHGSYICSPAGFGKKSRCFAR